MATAISPAELKRRIRDKGELAILDLREEGAHSRSHLFYGSSLPLSRLELRVLDLVPRLSTPVVLVDDDGSLATRAADKLEAFGYSDVAVLDGGVPGWEAAGYILFSGVHVPSKAFGEWVEHHCGTPHIDATELQAMMDAGADLVVLDSRPMDEYRVMNIPSSTDVPGAELALRVHDLAPDPDTTVVVNCAGRTRSIIGAQSLINAGIPNRVTALKNGTMGWHLAGFELERGQSRRYGETLSPEARARADRVVAHVARRYGVASIDKAGLAKWRAEAGRRTLYVVDVRAAEEYEAGHLAGSIWAPGGQLVQETESWLATLGARVVLVDDARVRAYMTASWLLQMGWEEVAVLADPFAGETLQTGPQGYRLPSIAEAAHDSMTPAELQAALASDAAVVVDLALSKDYAAGHVPGAWFAVRARLAKAFARLPGSGAIVFTSADGIVARLAAPEASELTARPVQVLAGGSRAWAAAGLPLEGGLAHMADEADDIWLKPYEEGGNQEENMRRYLAWELDLVENIERDGDHRFRLYPA
jgi:rhodanese-related sulfurtransferase